jgi:hypothetical protein
LVNEVNLNKTISAGKQVAIQPKLLLVMWDLESLM